MTKRPVRLSFARLFLAMTGWKPEGRRPEPARFVLIAAPHTSNWDFPYMLAFAEHFGVQVSWMGKDALFRPPWGPLMSALGGIPVRRHQRENLVQAMARAFGEREKLHLAVPAEGTRSHVDYWKSGFYHIAMTANVPIVLSYLDYARKRGGFGPTFHPTGDVGKDMDFIRAFYADKQGRFPEQFGAVRLLEEEDAPPAPPIAPLAARVKARSATAEGDDGAALPRSAPRPVPSEVDEDR